MLKTSCCPVDLRPVHWLNSIELPSVLVAANRSSVRHFIILGHHSYVCSEDVVITDTRRRHTEVALNVGLLELLPVV